MAEETHPCDYAYPVAPGDVAYWQPGMTLRDYIAAAALPQAVMDYGEPLHGSSSGQRRDRGKPVLPYATSGAGTREEIIARQAYKYADAMMRARKSQ
jgi:hypothetical protein